jgi:hypothetical protein
MVLSPWSLQVEAQQLLSVLQMLELCFAEAPLHLVRLHVQIWL